MSHNEKCMTNNEYRCFYSGPRATRERPPPHNTVVDAQRLETLDGGEWSGYIRSPYLYTAGTFMLDFNRYHGACDARQAQSYFSSDPSVLGYGTSASSIMPGRSRAFAEIPTDHLPFSTLRSARKIFEERGIPDGGHSSRAPGNSWRQ